VQAILAASSVTTVLVSWKKCAVTSCLRLYRCLWRVLGGDILAPECKSDLQRPKAFHATTVNRIGVNKVTPNFDILFATYVCRSALKG